MTSATLSIDLGALVRNWQTLDAMSSGETGAVVKANGYGLGAPVVGRALLRAGVRSFFVATADEGNTLRGAIGQGPAIYVFSGHMAGDTAAMREAALTPLLNSVDQMLRHVEALPGHPFGIQLDSGMNRLGMEPAEWSAVRDIAVAQGPALVMSHLACADEPKHPMNAHQLAEFRAMTDGLDVPRSLAATGGTILGPEYHFDMTRPGIGLYGGLPFVDAEPVVTLDLPVIQVRDVAQGETVGYGNAWTAPRDARIATVSGGYADGLIRAMGPKATLYAGEVPCPVVGRVSMDLITADVTDVGHDPNDLQLMGQHQSVDTVADAAGTIGYEILTSLGLRYHRALVQ
ncbi:alanine racemase [Tateyamaria sp. ANG-S1]|uniref:alanine racemase n=1 Tax=Tateyamaria sp. ANG-S1 TaxID=1577905 RepID=UPI00057F36A8|nr:alanine racemase [Tateyamaria sp. ANG-S1]KIC48540.1 alanine racemase [Tateyamaria sp. ANG-S1]